ncbi:protein TonB [Nonlabens sp. Hel1_33_55]|uniref:energy transducer TonB n=1 Tax=Nonlabens sp. Hel1_33_55 TaxID=1336802 RepID=UPI000875D464|nr:energy transducer TonB [Nonlabens sp. Hel1_33_55]SCY39693.1 protein TonB [Nonlabens sp. Hel1_33_55]
MRNLDSNVGAATPTGTSRADKKSASIKTNSTINFLIGLCAVLMFSFVVIELQTPKVEREFTKTFKDNFVMETNMGEYRIEKADPKPEPQKRIQEPKISEPKVNKIKPPVVIDNNDPEPTTDPDPTQEPSTDTTKDAIVVTSGDISNDIPVVNSNTPLNMLSVSEVPLYPGCSAKLDNEERISCFNEKMARYVQRRFDTSLANELNGKELVNITVLFTIGTDGLPQDIQVRAPNKKLETEAYRIISKLPKMTPGKFEGADVNTTYALPIKFRVQS